MSLDEIITGLIYLIAVFIVFLAGKVAYNLLNKQFDLNRQLVKEDNFAVALTIVGYYLGLLFAIGGILYGPSNGLLEDVIDIFFWGIMAIILLNISGKLNDKIILSTFDNTKEIIDDKNAGTGAVEGANYLAVGLIVSGALSGEGGDIFTGLVFWFLGQATLILAEKAYNFITPFDIHAEIEKDNVAVGVAFAGVLIAIGNLIRVGIAGDFVSWQENISDFLVVIIFGLVLLPVVRYATDKILLPGENLTDELVNQEKPNVGAGLIEAFSYVAASFLLGWVL